MASPGSIGWTDLTVPDADRLQAFYSAVTGCLVEPVSMGEYNDYNLIVDGKPIAGVCHARGTNSDVPPAWLLYFNVTDMEASLAQVRQLGGEVLRDTSTPGYGRMVVIKDPAGVVCALWQGLK